MKYLKYFEAKKEYKYLVCLAHRHGAYYDKPFLTLKGAIKYMDSDPIKFHNEYINSNEILYKFILNYNGNYSKKLNGSPYIVHGASVGGENGDAIIWLGADAYYNENLVMWSSDKPEVFIIQNIWDRDGVSTCDQFYSKYRNSFGGEGLEDCCEAIYNDDNERLKNIILPQAFKGYLEKNPVITMDLISNLISYLDDKDITTMFSNGLFATKDGYFILNKLTKIPRINDLLKKLFGEDALNSGSKMGDMGF